MARNDSELIFEQYYHSITDIVEEARGRKKQFSERVKQVITDPKTGEKRLESYYEMMQRIKRQALMQQADAEYEAEKKAEGEATPESEAEAEVETEIEPEVKAAIDAQSVPTDEEDTDVDITAGPQEDVGSFNFDATLEPGDLAEKAPKDGMTQEIIQYLEDSPATGKEVVAYLVGKGVNETDAKNKVASLAMLDILKLYFSGEEKAPKPSLAPVLEPDEESDYGNDEDDDTEEYGDILGDLPEVTDEFSELPEEPDLPEYSEEDLPGNQL
jgi:hypothetical protein